jgi:hypothetical protein
MKCFQNLRKLPKRNRVIESVAGKNSLAEKKMLSSESVSFPKESKRRE